MIVGCSRDSGLALANAWFEFGDYEKYNEIMRLIKLPKESNNIEGMSDLLLIKKNYNDHKEKTNRLLKLNEQGIQLYSNALYPAATTIFLEAYEIMPNNIQLSLNLAQSIVKGWPPTEEFSRKKIIAKQCIKVVEAGHLSGASKQRYDAIEKELKAI
jgi:hypothetical protein